MRWRWIANQLDSDTLASMTTLTIPAVNDALHRKLAERAQANHRTIEAEALCCLVETLEAEASALAAIPANTWAEIEQSVCETMHDQGTLMTDGDFQRYRELARGRNRP
jgi:plasmid stability protein